MSMQKWEYKVSVRTAIMKEEELNSLGSEGWELVSWAIAGHDEAADYHYLVLKRPKLGQ